MRHPFGKTKNGQDVEALSIHAGDITVTILTLGAIVQDVHLKGVPHSLTLGSEDIAAYDGGDLTYFGALVGPVANRIANARAPLGGDVLSLVANEGTTCLHGGPDGMETEIWTVESLSENAVTLTLELADGKGGFPGNRHLRVRYSVDAPAHLRMNVEAKSDKDTLLNIANHSYWNLDGRPTNTGHVLRVNADRYLPVDAASIPTGVADVAGVYDLREGREFTAGTPVYDHSYCLNGAKGTLKHACTLTGQSGLSMRMDTTEVGLQVFDAGHVSSGDFIGHEGHRYPAFAGIALEAQGWPDAPNHADFPSIEVAAGETYRQETVWSFSR